MKRSTATSGNLVKKADASNGYRLWITATGALQFEVFIGGTTKSVTSATTIPLNTWKHVAARYDGSELRVFIGGTIEAATTAATGSLTATTEALWLGYYDGTSHHLNGYLDDVSIYARALSDTEITNLSNNQMGRYEYHHTNALGSNIVLTDDDQNVIVRYEYDVFGAIRSEVGTSDNPRKFTGKEYESDVKLYYFAARYYDPYIGRFIMRDPAGQGVNWYLYTENNPLTRIDPDGQAWETVIDIGGALWSGWQFIKKPSWGGGAEVLWNTGSIFVPFVPGTWAGRIVVRVASKADPSVYKGAKFTKNTYRKYLRQMTGEPPPGYEAHHIIPKAVHDDLARLKSDINPHSPEFLTWWKGSPGGTHQNFATQYSKEWRDFMRNDPTDEQIMKFARQQAEKYKHNYWNKEYYFELYREVPMGSESQFGWRKYHD